jgi:hypothetical protein
MLQLQQKTEQVNTKDIIIVYIITIDIITTVEFKQLKSIYFQIGIGMNNNVHDVYGYDVYVYDVHDCDVFRIYLFCFLLKL